MLTEEYINEQFEKLRDKLLAEIDTLQAEQAESSKGFFEPNDGDLAYFIDTTCDICSSYSWETDEDMAIIAQGSAFATEQEAIDCTNLRACEHRLKKAYFDVSNGTNKFIYGKNNHYIVLDDDYLHTTTSTIGKLIPSWMYLHSEQEAEHIIEHHKDDLLMYLRQ